MAKALLLALTLYCFSCSTTTQAATSVARSESPANTGTASVADPEAQASSLDLRGSFVSVNPSNYGAELGAAYLFAINSRHSFWVGPRVSSLWAGGSDFSRLDFQFGAEGILWFLNAFGLGLGVDLVAPSYRFQKSPSETLSQAIHVRFNPAFSVRFRRFQEDGAWSARFGILYDTMYQWGVQLGLSLQLTIGS